MRSTDQCSTKQLKQSKIPLYGQITIHHGVRYLMDRELYVPEQLTQSGLRPSMR